MSVYVSMPFAAAGIAAGQATDPATACCGVDAALREDMSAQARSPVLRLGRVDVAITVARPYERHDHILSIAAQEPHAAPTAKRAPRRRTLCGLPPWRLKRVEAYVSANLGKPVTLATMAAAAGLSRMHFAAQFRATTGMPPHAFLLRQRIARAQELMLATRDPIVAIALDVGFETQAHFTSVFKRMTGETPNRWRCSIAERDKLSRAAA